MITDNTKFLAINDQTGTVYPEIITLEDPYQLFKERLKQDLQVEEHKLIDSPYT